MSDAIGPGDWVECVDVSPSPSWEPALWTVYLAHLRALQLGATYEVASVGRAANGEPSLQIAGVRSAFDNGWLPSRFRPRRRPWAEWLTSEPTPADREGVVV